MRWSDGSPCVRCFETGRRGYISELMRVPASILSARYQREPRDLVCMPVSAGAEQTMPAKALIYFLAAPAATGLQAKWDGAGITADNERVRAEGSGPRSAG